MPASTHTENRYAVCVGINAYADTAALAPLAAAEANATEVDQVLHELGFPPEQRCLLTGSQATLEAINDALDTFILNHPGPNDLVVFYFAGHGVPVAIADASGASEIEIFLTPFDFDRSQVTKPSFRKRHALSLRRLRTDYFEGKGSRKRLFIFDSCYSGDFFGAAYRSDVTAEEVQTQMQRLLDNSSTGRVALSSCLPYQKARDNPAMTAYLLPALRGTVPAAQHQDGCITPGSLHYYLTTVMGEQKPVLSGVQHDAFKLFCYGPPPSTQATPASEQMPPDTASRDGYLAHLIDTYRVLRLPDGREVDLERIYVSLKADRMNAAERQAEHAFYLEDVATLWQLEGITAPDQYAAFAAMRRVIVRRPRMHMLQARSWQQLFGTTEERSLSLAEVVQRHQVVVLLGDPGSGKTTLGRWLVLQYARALHAGVERVQVRADHVRPGADAAPIDLDRPRLPIFVRIADYARARWGSDPIPDLTLERFVERGLYHRMEALPIALNPTVVGMLAREALAAGQALVILDGLDEVGDLRQRQTVMHAIQEAIPSWRAHAADGNRVVLTSRIVGYQFHPLTHLPHYTVEEMDDTAITAFCHAWMRHVAVTDAEASEEQGQHLADAIIEQTQPGVRLLAGNPLLLTILAQVYWQSSVRALPTRRVDLFDTAAHALYDQRESFWERAGIPRLRLYRALAAVAAYLHAEEVTGFAEEGSIRACLATVLPDAEQVEAVLAAAREVSGFLVERGGGVYGFLHRALQEYFAARSLVDEDTPLVERLARLQARLLDPTWREPLLLAVGRVSRRSYPDSRRVLPQVFELLLDTPDPAGTVLPRRELLAAAAAGECERVPDGVGQRVAARLLTFYARRAGQTVAAALRKRIEQAFTTLRSSPAYDEVTNALCVALQTDDFEQRFAAIDLVIDLEWDAPAIVQALLVAWQTYPDPAASMLVALEGLHERHPDWFTPALLPFRQAVEQEPALWERIQRNPGWQPAIRLLYLPPVAAFEPGQITHDSPLTTHLLAVLRQSDDAAALIALHDDLLPAASQPGTARARDAALLLSAAGDTRWIAPGVAQSGPAGAQLRPVAAILARDLARALDYALARDLDRALDYASDRDRASASASASALASALASASDRDRTHGLALARDRDLDRASDRASALASALARLQEIGRHIDAVRSRWGTDPEIVAALERAAEHLATIRSLLELDTPVAVTLEALWQAWAERNPPQDEGAAEVQNSALTMHTLPALAENLAAADDRARAQARTTLVTDRPASALDQALIEQIAEEYLHQQQQYQVGTQFDWALNCIKHDHPDWLRTWIAQATAQPEPTAARTILSHIHHITPDAYAVLLATLPSGTEQPEGILALPGGKQTLLALLDALGWLARLDTIPEEQRSATFAQLSGWLMHELDTDLRRAVIELLGYWRSEPANTTQTLLHCLEYGVTAPAEADILYASLARSAARAPELHNQTYAVLRAACQQPGAAAALTRLLLAQAQRDNPFEEKYPGQEKRQQHQERVSAALLHMLADPLPDPLARLTALLDAGVDDDVWDDDHHGLLVRTTRQQVQTLADQGQAALAHLVKRLQTALAEQGGPARRIILAAIAACTEAMPTAVQRAAQQIPGCNLEALLVKATSDAESFSTRRFALTILSHLRTVTPALVPALLAGCQDVAVVQQDTIAAAKRFQAISGNPLPDLVPALIGESVSTAYAVAQLLGALGASAAGEAAWLRDEIITALVDALNHERSQREVVLEESYIYRKDTLADTLYAELLRVAGWPA